MLQKFMKIASNSEQPENTKGAERQKKTSFPKEQVENTDLYKSMLHKMTTQEQCAKYKFASPLTQATEIQCEGNYCVLTFRQRTIPVTIC